MEHILSTSQFTNEWSQNVLLLVLGGVIRMEIGQKASSKAEKNVMSMSSFTVIFLWQDGSGHIKVQKLQV